LCELFERDYDSRCFMIDYFIVSVCVPPLDPFLASAFYVLTPRQCCLVCKWISHFVDAVGNTSDVDTESETNKSIK